MSLGFEQAGFHVAACVDTNQFSLDAHTKNFPHTASICRDVARLNGDEIRRLAKLRRMKISVVFGGPPCQGFSIGGKMTAADPRNLLIMEFGRLVVDLAPDYFVLENVYGLLEPRYAELIGKFTRRMNRGGYSVVTPLSAFDAWWFGVPQRRKRVFILGHRKSLTAPVYPTPCRDRAQCPTVWDAIGDLAVVESCKDLLADDAFAGSLGEPSPYAKVLRGELADPEDRSSRSMTQTQIITGFRRTNHSAQTVDRFSKIAQGAADPTSRFLRLRQDGLSSTLRAGTGVERGSFMAPRPIHPIFHRCICLREAARLHSFPDWFVFHEAKWHGFMQIGNSVPPRLARAVAAQIMKAIEAQSTNEPKRGSRRIVS
jgi:DNA (cytosine-5)-methyltransferase 1